MAEQSAAGGGGGGEGGGGGGGVRRRNLEGPMKESQARTKVVVRHLPPSMSQEVLLEYLDSKFAGCYTWFSFRPGKASPKKQILSRAYINFKKADDVYDFYEAFDGHIFVNPKGVQYKVTVEYAPYQRAPKPRSKKDVREGTIFKDPDYLEFLETLGKPSEFLPSAEVQLERREAEKAAALGANGGKDSVVVTPLMEFVRQRRAAKATPQRPLSSKLPSRAGGAAVATLNSASHKRALDRSRSGSQMDFKEVQTRDHIGGLRREESQRKDREVTIERRKKDGTEAKERKPAHDAVSTSSAISKGSAVTILQDSSKESTHVVVLSKEQQNLVNDIEPKANESLALGGGELSISHSPATGKSTGEGTHGDSAKEFSKRDIAKRKQLMVVKDKLHKESEAGPTSPGQVAVSGGGYQRHRPPVSPRIATANVQSQLATSGDGLAASTSTTKSNQRRDLSGRNSSRGAVSPRDQQSPSQQHAASHVLIPDLQSQGSPQSERGGKRPPRPQNMRSTGKEQLSGLASSLESEVGSSSPGNPSSAAGPAAGLIEEKLGNTSSSPALELFSGQDRQDPRRVRNKDRPDRPVWTPRRRSDTAQTSDPSSSTPLGSSSSTTTLLPEASELKEPTSKPEKSERSFQRLAGKAVSNAAGQSSAESSKGGESHLGAGEQTESRRGHSGSQAGYAAGSGKAKFVEFGNSRSARGARSVTVNHEHAGAGQGEHRGGDPFVSGSAADMKVGLHNIRESSESYVPAEKDKRKQDITPQWSESTGGIHRSGERRRERGAQHGSRDSDGSAPAAEVSKPTKRGGSLALGSNEKQVWVAVQKSGSAT